MTLLLPITVDVERMVVIGFPFHHRSIMTTKTVVIMLAVMWGLSAILTTIIMITVPIDIVWPLGLMHYHQKIYPILVVPQLISIICIVAANGFLKYKIALSNRKAAENQMKKLKILKLSGKRFEHRPRLPSHYS